AANAVFIEISLLSTIGRIEHGHYKGFFLILLPQFNLSICRYSPRPIAETEVQIVEQAVRESGGNVSEAARLLGTSRTRL
ncbi:MAG: transcriptional regulator of acetoin/glycerol metabolism, partial [Planctomycetota bacterium]